MSEKISIPSYYTSKEWIESAGTCSLKQRLQNRIFDLERKLPNMTLKECQDLYRIEPYWEVSNLIAKTKDFLYPK